MKNEPKIKALGTDVATALTATTFKGFIAEGQTAGNSNAGVETTFTATNFIEVIDTENAFDPVAGTYTIPTGLAGYWTFDACIRIATVQTFADVRTECRLVVQGSTKRRITDMYAGSTLDNPDAPSPCIATTVKLNAGDVVRIDVLRRTDEGSNSYTTNTGADFTWFTGTYVGA